MGRPRQRARSHVIARRHTASVYVGVMIYKQPWKATHRAILRDRISGETIKVVLVMMIDDRKAYQEYEWEPGAQMGDPDIMKDPDEVWTYKIDAVFANFEPVT